jgi:hypothetical protein
MNVWVEFIWLKIGTSDGSCKHGNKPWGSIKVVELVEYLSYHQLLKKDFASFFRRYSVREGRASTCLHRHIITPVNYEGLLSFVSPTPRSH